MVSRRSFLGRAAALGLSFSLPALTARAVERRGSERPMSLITLWMQGGPSQLETWDPHPGTPIGGPTTAIDTTVPGLRIASTFPKMAEMMHHTSVIRSLVSKEGDHERGSYHVLTGYRPDPTVVHPSVGAVLSHELPATGVEIPLHISLAGGAGFTLPRGGYLGDEYDAFRIYEPGRGLINMRSRVGDSRTDRRRDGLAVVERAFQAGRTRPASETLHRQMLDKAVAMMSSEQLTAFDIDKEPAAVAAAYGDTRFGRGCLVARRLVETGVRSVQVVLDGFDTHTDNFEGCKTQAAILDPALATLLNDLAQRDLLASTIVLCIGEFGRTPRINPLDGRDHWPGGFSCVIAGGGLKTGVVVGATDPEGLRREPERPVPIADLYTTLFQAMSVDPSREINTPIGRPMKLSEGQAIGELNG
ncbi:DUF1501 domain-containing protein [Caulifigura coniformis]|nr:DUF1501 domain-containing protein [Caulifigura coniformis]